jgi:hypothetical protein
MRVPILCHFLLPTLACAAHLRTRIGLAILSFFCLARQSSFQQFELTCQLRWHLLLSRHRLQEVRV